MGRSPRRHTSESVLAAVNNGRVPACLLSLFDVVVPSSAADDAKGVAFFETRIRPGAGREVPGVPLEPGQEAQGRAQGR